MGGKRSQQTREKGPKVEVDQSFVKLIRFCVDEKRVLLSTYNQYLKKWEKQLEKNGKAILTCRTIAYICVDLKLLPSRLPFLLECYRGAIADFIQDNNIPCEENSEGENGIWRPGELDSVMQRITGNAPPQVAKEENQGDTETQEKFLFWAERLIMSSDTPMCLTDPKLEKLLVWNTAFGEMTNAQDDSLRKMQPKDIFQHFSAAIPEGRRQEFLAKHEKRFEKVRGGFLPHGDFAELIVRGDTGTWRGPCRVRIHIDHVSGPNKEPLGRFYVFLLDPLSDLEKDTKELLDLVGHVGK